MADVQTERDLRSIRRSLAAQGIEGNVDVKVSEKRQWWKADGTPLSTLLPDDDYHRSRFMARGWTLVDPGIIQEPEARQGLSPIELEVARAEALSKEKAERLALEQYSPTPFLDAGETETTDTTEPETETVEENENG